jgi:hypothetical protein
MQFVHFTIYSSKGGAEEIKNIFEPYLIAYCYICDICKKDFENNENLTNIQCEVCKEYYDICQSEKCQSENFCPNCKKEN